MEKTFWNKPRGHFSLKGNPEAKQSMWVNWKRTSKGALGYRGEKELEKMGDLGYQKCVSAFSGECYFQCSRGR